MIALTAASIVALFVPEISIFPTPSTSSIETVDGLSYEILENALAQAKEGRMHILGKILEAQPEAREDLKPHAPRIETMIIGKEFIGAVIGPGGKIIQGMIEEIFPS